MMKESSNRRNFVSSSFGGLLLASPLGGLVSSCKTVSGDDDDSELQAIIAGAKPSRRKSLTDTSNKNNIESYARAVARMRATPFPRGGGSWWEVYANIHNNSCPHNNWFFFPWHRAYLYFFEYTCRYFSGDSDFALPYWDWNEARHLPNVMFDNANLRDSSRNLRKGEAINVGTSSANSVSSILDISDFYTFNGGGASRPRNGGGFSGRLESAPHNAVHSRIGGTMGGFLSPRDPVFWLHHCNVDRLWTVWQTRREARKQPILPPIQGQNGLGRSYFLNYNLTGFWFPRGPKGSPTAASGSLRINELVRTSKLKVAFDQQRNSTIALAGNTDPQVISYLPDSNLPTLETVADLDIDLDGALTEVLNLADTGKAWDFSRKYQRTEGLGAALDKAILERGNKEATLRLVVSKIPTPKDPLAELHFFINGSAKNENDPGYAGMVTFFGHNHGDDLGAAFDLVPMVKALVKAGKKPFAGNAPLTFTAYWNSKDKPSLAELRLSLKYSELG